MRRALFIILLLSLPARAADVAFDVDIPASESADDEPVPDELVIDNEPPAAVTKLKKRDAEPDKKPEDEAVVVPPSNVVVLQGLNKVIGRVSTIEAPIGTLARFENLEIIARKCVKSPLDERPENSALLEVREIKVGEEPKQIFLGWMMSSSPGLSSLEHPVYDITVLSCEYKKDLE